MWKYCKGNRIIKIFGRHKLVPTLRSGKVWQIWCFTMFFFNFATTISKLDTFSSYHIVRARITKVAASFFLFALSELLCTKNVFYLFYYSLYFSPQASFPLERYRQRNFNTPFALTSFFFTERAGPYPQAQLYWAGRTMGWMADWMSLFPNLSDPT